MSNETYTVRECINGRFVTTTLNRTWGRVRIPQRDYVTYSLEDYNMRRKAEVLKYNQNKVKDNSVTRVANFSRIAKGNIFRNRISLANCQKKNPAYRSGVPGSKLLFLNNSVPLYDYGNPTREYLAD